MVILEIKETCTHRIAKNSTHCVDFSVDEDVLLDLDVLEAANCKGELSVSWQDDNWVDVWSIHGT